MKLEQFNIGDTFYNSGGYEWLCTDKGTRTVNAIRLSAHKDKSWFNGPPYAVNEYVFDEYDIGGCYLSTESLILESLDKVKVSSHPGFRQEDVDKIMDEKFNEKNIGDRNRNLMKRSRVGDSGEIFHPYGCSKKSDGWYIKTFELFSHEFSQIHENKFVTLKIADENNLKARAEDFNKQID